LSDSRPEGATINRPRIWGNGDDRSATPLALGRTTAWALAIWSGYIATWAWASGSGPVVVIAWWLAGVCVVKAIAPHAARPGGADRERAASAEDEPASRDTRA
jgi:hypothetical protein